MGGKTRNTPSGREAFAATVAGAAQCVEALGAVLASVASLQERIRGGIAAVVEAHNILWPDVPPLEAPASDAARSAADAPPPHAPPAERRKRSAGPAEASKTRTRPAAPAAGPSKTSAPAGNGASPPTTPKKDRPPPSADADHHQPAVKAPQAGSLRARILDLFRGAGDRGASRTTTEVTEALKLEGKEAACASATLSQLVKMGQLDRASRGRYALPGHAPAAGASKSAEKAPRKPPPAGLNSPHMVAVHRDGYRCERCFEEQPFRHRFTPICRGQGAA